MDPSLLEQLLAFYQTCDAFQGKLLQVQSYLSTHRDNYDRHFTSYTQLEFKLTYFGIRFSGNRACFYGDTQSYEIASDLIQSFQAKSDTEYEIVEIYSEKVYRCTKLKFG